MTIPEIKSLGMIAPNESTMNVIAKAVISPNSVPIP